MLAAGQTNAKPERSSSKMANAKLAHLVKELKLLESNVGQTHAQITLGT